MINADKKKQLTGKQKSAINVLHHCILVEITNPLNFVIMSVLVYIHPDCERDAKTQGYFEDVNRFKEAILKDQRTTLFDNFPPPFLKKRFSRQHRLIAAEQKINGNIVVCFLRLLIRGGDEYLNFIRNPKNYGDNHFLPMIEDVDLYEWVETQLNTCPPPQKNDLSDDETNFLWSIFEEENNMVNDVVIYESEEWINTVMSEDYNYKLIQVPLIIINIISTIKDDIGVGIFEGSKLKIIFRYFKQLNKLYLFDLISIEKDTNLEFYRQKYAILFEQDKSIHDEEIIKCSLRGYPSLLLIEEHAWISIQRDREANLALSPEEVSVITSVHENNSENNPKIGFPLFINGRAGSGKSTILQYLFSDYLRSWLNLPINTLFPPLYLTYSKELVSRSKLVIHSLLISGYKKSLTSSNKYSEQNIEETLGKSIQSFKEYLLNLLSSEIRSIIFPDKGYIDFSRFKNLWNDKFSRNRSTRKYGSDICWHIIRTYIKGLSTDDFLDDLAYDELPRREKSVSIDAYNWVYNNIWKPWYKDLFKTNERLTDEQYWDDQDLVRYILENNLAKPAVSVVFCDEAQDFTRIELELLLRISLFSDRKLTSVDLNKVPFAFAGDPYQTLNPTGFRWESIKASFVHKFVYSMLPSDRYGVTDLNYRELNYNYRSTKEIVYLCNSIQLLRSSFFDYSDVYPQETWKSSEKPQLPSYFYNSNSTLLGILSEQTDLRIIIPCGEGEEQEYYNSDSFLREVIPIENEVPRNLMSPTRIKGLEFNRVIIYGFGKYFLDNFGDNASGFKNIFEHIKSINDNDKKLPIEYFINWLYVAASRPKKQLFIIDSENGINYFWDFVKSDEHLPILLSSIREKNVWEDKLGLIQPGSERSWGDDREDPRDVAKRYQKDGIERGDPYFLRQAASIYKRVQDYNDYHISLGYALFFEEKYLESGNEFYLAQRYKDSLHSLWQGNNYKEISKLFSDGKTGLETDLKVRFSNLMSGGFNITEFRYFMNHWVFVFNSSDTKNDNLYNFGSQFINNILYEKIKSIPNIEEEHEQWLFIWRDYIILLNAGLFASSELATEIAFRARDYQKVVEIGMEKHQRYYESKIMHLKTKKIETLIPSDMILLGDFFFKEGNLGDSWEYFEKAQNISGLEKILEIKLLKEFDKNEKEVLWNIKTLASVMINNKQWVPAMELIANNSIAGKYNKHLSKALKYKDFITNSFFAELIATSTISSIIENDIKSIYSDFLNEVFIKSHSSNWEVYINPMVVGTAIERCGRFIDALEFYDKMTRNTNDKKTRIEYEKRWIKSKLNLADRIEKNDRERSSSHRQDADDRAAMQNIKTDSIPEYYNISIFLNYSKKDIFIQKWELDGVPENTISNLNINKTRTQNNKILKYRFDFLTIKYSSLKKRINFEHNETLSTAVIDINAGIGKSDDFEVINDNNISNFSEWAIKVNLEDKKNNIVKITSSNGKELTIHL